MARLKVPKDVLGCVKECPERKAHGMPRAAV